MCIRTRTHHSGEDEFERVGRGVRLVFAAGQTVAEGEQRLTHRIRVRHLAVVHQRHVPHTPTLKTTTECLSTWRSLVD